MAPYLSGVSWVCRLVNGTTGIAPCAIRMVYLFRSHHYYDDRGAVFCEQPGAASHLPLLDRHLRSVVRYGAGPLACHHTYLA